MTSALTVSVGSVLTRRKPLLRGLKEGRQKMQGDRGTIGGMNHADMSLRLYLIGQALTGLCASPDYTSYVQAASEAIKVADMVLNNLESEKKYV